MNLRSIIIAPVHSQNFSIGVLAYSLPEQTITRFMSLRLTNFAAVLILLSVISISNMYNPSGLDSVIY